MQFLPRNRTNSIIKSLGTHAATILPDLRIEPIGRHRNTSNVIYPCREVTSRLEPSICHTDASFHIHFCGAPGEINRQDVMCPNGQTHAKIIPRDGHTYKKTLDSRRFSFHRTSSVLPLSISLFSHKQFFHSLQNVRLSCSGSNCTSFCVRPNVWRMWRCGVSRRVLY